VEGERRVDEQWGGRKRGAELQGERWVGRKGMGLGEDDVGVHRRRGE